MKIKSTLIITLILLSSVGGSSASAFDDFKENYHNEHKLTAIILTVSIATAILGAIGMLIGHLTYRFGTDKGISRYAFEKENKETIVNDVEETGKGKYEGITRIGAKYDDNLVRNQINTKEITSDDEYFSYRKVCKSVCKHFETLNTNFQRKLSEENLFDRLIGKGQQLRNEIHNMHWFKGKLVNQLDRWRNKPSNFNKLINGKLPVVSDVF